MFVFSMETEECERCFDCVTACPRSVFAEGETYPVVAHPEECIGCGVCRVVCRPKGISYFELPDVHRPTPELVLH